VKVWVIIWGGGVKCENVPKKEIVGFKGLPVGSANYRNIFALHSTTPDNDPDLHVVKGWQRDYLVARVYFTFLFGFTTASDDNSII
jgi:hypothetical protein